MRNKSYAALLVLLAIGMIGAGSAQAAATTTAAQWYTGTSPGTTLTATETFKGAIKSGTTFTLESKLGSSGTPVKLKATGIECVSCTIENKEVTGKAGKSAFGTGKVNFTGVTAVEPATCAVTSETGVAGQILSKSLNGHGDFMNGTTAVAQVIPAAGAGSSFGVVKLVNGSGTCPVPGTYSVTGTLFIDWEVTATFSVNHSAQISPAIETADGGALSIGSQPMNITGTAVTSLGSGKEWTIK